MALNVQKQIRDNATELQDFLKDLKDWEKRMKDKDPNVQSKKLSQEKFPPVRGHDGKKPSVSQKADFDLASSSGEGQPKIRRMPAPHTNEASSADKVPNAAGHTHNFLNDKWDKFDVDSALKELDEDAPRVSKYKVLSERQVVSDSHNKRSPPSSSGSVGGQTGARDQFTSLNRVSEALRVKEPPPDAASEKELGNEFFKEKKYVQAIDCYSRSLALQPTAVAYANRAMAFLKIRRFEEAEVDCTEAISLDDRYTKAYSRRGTARRELKKYLEAVEDFEFALRLEPQNKELQNQYVEAKRLFEKEVNYKPLEEKVPLVIKHRNQGPIDLPTTPITPNVTNVLEVNSSVQEIKPPISSSYPATKVNNVNNKNIAATIQAAAARAAATAMTSISRNIVAPKTSYEFETTWKGLAGDRSSQVQMLKILDPQTLPKLFKDSLGAPLLVDIVQTLGLLFSEDANLVIQFLESLTRVGRFSMTIMFLNQQDKAALKKLWDEVFTAGQILIENVEQLEILREKYRLGAKMPC